MRQASKQTQVSKLSISEAGKTMTVLSSPAVLQQFQSHDRDPFMQHVTAKRHDLVCLQHDPHKVMLRFRHFVRTSLDMTPSQPMRKDSFEFDLPVVHDLQELRANLEISNYLKPATHDPTKMIENLYSNIISHNSLSYPFVTSCVIHSLLKGEKVNLIDIPDALLAMKVANSLSLEELRSMHAKVLNVYRNMEKDKDSEVFTCSEILHMQFPHIFQKPRDQFAIALLQQMILKDDILVVLSAPTFCALKDRWKYKILFDDVNKVDGEGEKEKEKVRGESDEVLVEKHAILDSMLGSRIWADKYMYNRFPYIARKELIDKERKEKLQGAFHVKFVRYSREIEEIRNRIENAEGEFR